MKIKKCLTSILIVLISVFTFYGCAEVEFIRAIDGTNKIIDKLVIQLDESKINKCGKTLDEVMGSIQSDMITFRNSIATWKEQFVVYPDLYGQLQTGIYSEVTVPSKSQISIVIEFANWSMFGLFYGKSDIEDFEYQEAMTDVGPFIEKILNDEYYIEDEGLFFYKYSMIKDTGIINDLENITINGINYYEKYTNITKDLYNKDDIDISQIFVYPDDRIYSNADEKVVEQGLTMLRWDFSDKADDFEMTIYKLAPKGVSWYVLALILSVIATIVVFVLICKNVKNQHIEKITKQEVEKDER